MIGMLLEISLKTKFVVAIIFHNGYGHTARQAEAERRSIEKLPGTSVLFLTSEEEQTRSATLERADAIFFGAPTYMRSVFGPFKTFMDWTSKVFTSDASWDKIAAGVTNSALRSGDKLVTLFQFTVFAAQLGMHWADFLCGRNHNYWPSLASVLFDAALPCFRHSVKIASITG
jgi:NAD(P)H dehydrogenase (quinone)